jgi:phosphoglycolate phosphatase
VTPLLLDLDGTLVDSKRDLARGVNLLLAEHSLPPLPVDIVVGFVGRGARSLIRRSLDHVDPEGEIGRDETILRRFLGHYEQVMLDTTVPFPGVVEGLSRLHDAGVPLAVVSNKPEGPTRRISDALELTRYFGVILGGDSTPQKKPSAMPLQRAAKELAVPLTTCVMVGDSDVDIQAAHAAGVPGIWCSWGGIHLDQPEAADKIVTSFSEVVEVGLRGQLHP